MTPMNMRNPSRTWEMNSEALHRGMETLGLSLDDGLLSSAHWKQQEEDVYYE